MTKKKKQPVDNDELRRLIVKSQEEGVLDNRAALLIQKLVKNLQKRFKYKNEDLKYDCYAQSIYHCINAWQKYDQNVSKNCFAWFTSVAWNGLCDGMNKAMKGQADYSIDAVFEESI